MNKKVTKVFTIRYIFILFFVVFFSIGKIVLANNMVKSKNQMVPIINFNKFQKHLNDIEFNKINIKYFESFYTNYAHPFVPKGEISIKNIEKNKNYIIAGYDEFNNLISIKKILEGKCLFWFIYIYDEKNNLNLILDYDSQCNKD